MKKYLITLLFFCQLLTSVFAQTWTRKADFGGTARMGAIGFSIGNNGYIGLGTDNYPSYNFKKDLWEYDPANNTWTQKADFGGIPRYDAYVFVIGTKAYVGTGWSPAYQNDCWVYDQITNSWSQKSDFFEARQAIIAFSIGNKGYAGTGSVAGDYLRKDFWEYDPASDSWTQKADFGGTARTGAGGFAINNKGYIGTGADNFNGNGINLRKDFWEYDPSTNSWTQKADFGGTARWCPAAFSIPSCNKGYIGAGTDYLFTNFRNDFWEYDPSSDSWTRKQDYGEIQGSHSPIGFSIASKGYIGTGYNAQTSLQKQFWEYNPQQAIALFTENADSGCNAVQVHFTNNSTEALSYIWNFGDGNSDTVANPTHVFNNSGSYTVTLTATASCPDSVSRVINITSGIPVANFSAIVEPCDALVAFNDASLNATSYLYNFGDGDSSNMSNPHHLYKIDGKHTTTLTINKGTPCENKISKDIETSETRNELFITNVFTPNGDGKNDVFRIDSLTNCDIYELKIFNRWGNLLLETSALPLIWDGTHEGKPVPDGVYLYILKSKDFSKAGMVTLIR